MAAVVDVPFLHPVLIGAIAVGGFLLGPPVLDRVPARWVAHRMVRIAVPLLVGLVVGGGVVSGGLVPAIGRLHLAAYTVFLVGGFALALTMLLRRHDAAGVPRPVVVDALLIAAVLGIIGARARYVWERWDRILVDASGDRHQALLIAADLDRGGAVWYGGALAAAVGVILFVRWRRVPVLVMADLAVPAMIAGLAIGRIGCLVNGCCYGAPTDLPWGIPCSRYPGLHVHPTQAYETIACGSIAAALWWWWPRRRTHGVVAMAGVLAYACWRFVNEGLRGDHDAFTWGGITTSQGTSVWLAVAAVCGLIWLRVRGRPVGSPGDAGPSSS